MPVTESFEEFQHSGQRNSDISKMYWPVLYHPGEQTNPREDGIQTNPREDGIQEKPGRPSGS